MTDPTQRSDRVVAIERAVIVALLTAVVAGAVAFLANDDRGYQQDRGVIFRDLEALGRATERNADAIAEATRGLHDLRVELAKNSSEFARQTETMVYQLTLTREELARHRAGVVEGGGSDGR